MPMVVRLLRRAAELVWAAVDSEAVGSARPVLGLGIDLATDEARNFLPDAIQLEGPMPVGDEPVGLLRSARQLLRPVATPEAGIELHRLRIPMGVRHAASIERHVRRSCSDREMCGKGRLAISMGTS